MQKIYNIEMLRGFAALAVLFWHYQHFYYLTPGGTAAFDATAQPLYSFFCVFFTHGYLAVNFFWLLSGFVFFYTYADKRAANAKSFFVYRFSRLYPLHFITLLVVAGLQLTSLALLNKYQVYSINDIYHFFLQLFMASYWGLEQGHSFNAPIWSVSVELISYLIFFMFIMSFSINILSTTAFLFFSLLLYKTTQILIFNCLSLFVLGGLVQQVNFFIIKNKYYAFNLLCAVVVLLVAILMYGYSQRLHVLQFLLFPAVLYFFVALEAYGFSFRRIGIFSGNLSYSVYLLHVPLQILILIILDYFFQSREIVDSPIFLFLWILTTVSLSYASYKYIELPSKIIIRQSLLR